MLLQNSILTMHNKKNLKRQIVKLMIFYILNIVYLNADTLNLKTGWNLVGTNQNISNINVLIPSANIIWKYKNGIWYATSPKESFLKIIKDNNISTFTSVEAGEGFWVYSSENISIEMPEAVINNVSFTLHSGLNLISLIAENDVNVSKFNYYPKIIILWKYVNNSWEAYSSYDSVIKELNELNIPIFKTINKYEGFWVYASQNLTLEISNDENNTQDFISASTKGTVYLGNLAEANVSIYEVEENSTLKLLWQETTSSGDNLDKIGIFDTHSSSLDDDKYYLYEVKGGYDWDNDDNGVLDQNYTINRGKLRAIIKGSTLKQINNFTISYISEYIFRYMQNHIYNDDFDSIEAELIKELFDTDSNGTGILISLANQFVPSRDFSNLNDDFKEFVPYLVEAIRDENITNLTSLITLNGIKFLETEAGNNGIFRAELNITSKISIGEISILVGLDGNESETFGSIIIPEIHKGTFIYPIEIDLSSYYDEDENKSLNITGETNFFVKINGVETTLIKPIELLENAFVKFQDITFEDDENLSDVIDVDEYIDENGTITNTEETILNNLFELAVNDGNLTFMPTIEIRNYFLDQNVSNLKIETALIINGTEYDLPITDFNNTINIEQNSKKNIAISFDLKQSDITNIVKTILDTILATINTDVDLSIPVTYPPTTLEEVINQNLDAITDTAVNGSEIDATIKFVLKDANNNEIDTYNYPIKMKINSKTFEAFMENLPLLIGGSLTIDDLLNSL